MKIVVTGGGRLGRKLAPILRELGHEAAPDPTLTNWTGGRRPSHGNPLAARL